MSYMPIPCPSCGGLVGADLKCTSCRSVFESAEEMAVDGLVGTSGRAEIIADSIGVGQDFWDAIGLYERYDNELDKIEIKNWEAYYGHKRPY